MKKFRILALGAVGALTAATALAAIDSSHHDLKTWNNTNNEVCLFCHGVQSTLTISGLPYGNVGDLCVTRCHSGSTIVGGANFAGDNMVVPNRPATATDANAIVNAAATVDAVNVNDGYGHGLVLADLFDSFGATNPDLGASPAATNNFAYVNGTGDLECTSCHNVHSNEHTPFLNSDLFNGTGEAATDPSFCQDCHYAGANGDNRGNSWAGSRTDAAPNGEHPVDLTLVVDADVTDSTNAERITRYIHLDTFGGQQIFAVASSNGTDLNGALGGNHYTTGGHVGGFTATASGAKFGCYTCHSAHQDANGDYLVQRNAVSADGTFNPLCVGCHGDNATGAADSNPGGVASLYFHPVYPDANADLEWDNATSVATYKTSSSKFVFTVDMAGLRGAGDQGSISDSMGVLGIGSEVLNPTAGTIRPRCTSCHDVHGGITNSQALADIDGGLVAGTPGDGAFTGTFCNACHGGSGLADVADGTDDGQTTAAGERSNTLDGSTVIPAVGNTTGAHHRTNAVDWCSNVTDADGDVLQTDAASWSAAAGDPGDCSDGLGCVDCHVFDGSVHSTAHNWD